MTAVKHVLIVLAYNDNAAIKTFLSHTANLLAIDKIIMIDNCSTTNLFEDVQNFISQKGISEKVDCIQTKHNGGYAFGNNVGMRYAIKTYNPVYISLSNADVTLNQPALEACMQALSSQERLAFVAPKMISNRPEEPSWSVPGYWDLVWTNFIVIQGLLKRLKVSKISGDSVTEVGVIAGSYYMGRRQTFEVLGFLDERTFLYGEENILGFKVRQAEMVNQILQEVEFTHHHSTSINATIQSVGKRLDILRNSCHVYLDHYLKVGPLKKFIFDVSYVIGKYTYLGVKHLQALFNKKSS